MRHFKPILPSRLNVFLLVLVISSIGHAIYAVPLERQAKKAAKQQAETKEEKAEETEEKVQEDPVQQEIDFTPACTDTTRPSNMIEMTQIEVDGETLSDISQYQSSSEIQFGLGTDYTDVDLSLIHI